MSKPLTTLQRDLGRMFSAPPRKPDVYASARRMAKRIAAENGIEIEKMAGGGFNIWPNLPDGVIDPFLDDHYVSDWDETLAITRVYKSLKNQLDRKP